MTSVGGALEAPRVSRSLAEAAHVLGLPAPRHDATVRGITLDSRRVQAGDVYAALPGAHTHGAIFAAQAIAAGAAAIFTDRAGRSLIGDAPQVPVLVLEDPRAALGPFSAWVFDYPAARLKTIAVTGTNGKTTVTALVEAAIRACGESVGAIGTTGVRVDGITVPSARTTPEAPDLQGMLAAMVARGVSVVAMEVSSHALVLSRVDGICFDESVFTNLGRDHLDFHEGTEGYFAAKRSLFVPDRSKRALVNVDDEWGRRIFAWTDVPARGFAVDADSADWRPEAVEEDGLGYRYRLRGPGVDQSAGTRLPGRFNLSNAVAAAGAAISCGYPALDVARGIMACPGAPGRMERIGEGSSLWVIVDYAHTPDAVAAATAVGRELADRRGGKLRVVLGAGGDRDNAKRPGMGAAAARVADQVVVTDDNPRTEDPAAIRAAILGGAVGYRARVLELGDREAAISQVIATAKPADVVMVLGKGHETGQEINNVMHPMDDRELVRAAIRARPE